MSKFEHIFALGLLTFVILTFSQHAEGFVSSIQSKFSPYNQQISLSQTPLKVQVVSKLADQQKGLSARQTLPAGAGMLFVFSEPVRPGFWMKDMRFSLDLIWLDSERKVTSISPNLGPKTYPQTFYPSRPIKYVLEVNAGWAASHKIKLGAQLRY
jgi:hypothetical protein